MSNKKIKADNWDGKSRPTNKAYNEGYNRIFGVKSNNGVKKRGHVNKEPRIIKEKDNEKTRKQT